jgi:hypothetical protein
MGAKLVGYYDQVGKEMGVPGRMKLAMLTKISSAQAATVEDSPANVKMFEDKIAELRKAA